MSAEQAMQRWPRGLGGVRAAWSAIPDDEKPDALAIALAEGEHWPMALREWLIEVLADFERRDVHGFDGEAARHAFARLPERLTIYRGTVAAETDAGVHWTLDPAVALHFAVDGHQWPSCPHPRRPMPGEPTTWHYYADAIGGHSAVTYVANVCERLRPVVLQCVVRRDDIRVVSFGVRELEKEVLIHPRHVADLSRTYATQPCEPWMLEELKSRRRV